MVPMNCRYLLLVEFVCACPDVHYYTRNNGSDLLARYADGTHRLTSSNAQPRSVRLPQYKTEIDNPTVLISEKRRKND